MSMKMKMGKSLLNGKFLGDMEDKEIQEYCEDMGYLFNETGVKYERKQIEKISRNIINGDHLDIDTLIELMLKSDWTADDVANELGEDFREQAQEEK